MPTITVNASDLDIILARQSLVRGSLDAKRPAAWTQFGYPELLTFEHFEQAYERGGAAFGAVHRILDKCWQANPRIKKRAEQNAKAKTKAKDEPTPWEQTLEKLFRKVRVFKKLRDLDRRNMIGRYAALIYRVADNKELREPMVRATKLVDIVPVFENQIRVTEWFIDQADADNFGKPRMFQYRMHMPKANDTQGQPEMWVDVHPSRVQILAEGSVGDMFEGVPLLRAGFNQLIDLEKISGGSAEGFLKNSARTLQVKFDADASPQVITQNADGSSSGKTVKEVIEENVQRLNRNIDSSILLQGGEASTLQTTMIEPLDPFQVAGNLFAASVRIPFTILFGQQTGRLASDEDQKDMNARCEARQDTELTPMLEEFIERMQACGVVDAGDFEVEWPPLDAPGDKEKIEQATKMAAVNKEGQAGGLTEPVFDANEIRRVAGFDERDDDGMPDEGELEAEAEAQRAHELALRTAAGGGRPAPGARPALAAA